RPAVLMLAVARGRPAGWRGNAGVRATLEGGMAQAAGRWGLYVIWTFLAGASVYSTLTAEFTGALVALVTLLLTLMPIYFSRRLGVQPPPLFVAAIAAFLCATLFLGEVGGFYHRFWWWDIALHLWSAVGFAVI